MEEGIARSPEQARELGDDLRTLVVDKKWTTPWQALVEELPKLTRLDLRRGVDLDPTPVERWPEGLVELEIVFADPATELVPWIEALPEVEVLEVWGSHLKQGELPAEIGRLQRLRHLELVSCGLRDLPDELAQCRALRSLDLRGLPMDSFPEVVCRLAGLEELGFKQKVKELPEALADLVSLTRLDLSTALNDGTMGADDREAHYFRPMPTVIARLPALQHLVLDRCGIFERDVVALAGHERLEHLSLMYSGIEDIGCVRGLPALRRLDLRTCYGVRDLSPLVGTRIESLSLHGNHYIEDISPILEITTLRELDIRSCSDVGLEPVFDHPGLETLKADDEVIERWQKRHAMKGVTKESLLAGLETDDAEQLAPALRLMIDWVDLYATRDRNPCYDLFGVRKADSGTTAVPLLSRAVQHPELESELVASVVGATFRSMYDSLQPTVDAVRVLIERGDVEAQKAVVAAFGEAGEYYDAGHRSWEDTVQDAFIDELFPAFHPDALVELLVHTGDDAFSSEAGDCMDALFAPAFAGAGEEGAARLLQRLESYVEEYQDYLGADYMAELLERIRATNADAVATLDATLEGARFVARWNDELAEASRGDLAPATSRAALERVVAAVATGELSTEQVSGLDRGIMRCIRACSTLPAGLARSLLDLSFAVDESWWRVGTMMLPLLIEDLDGLKALPEERTKAVADAVRGCVTKAAPDRRQVFLDGLAALTGQPVQELEAGLAAKMLQRAMKDSQSDLEGALAWFLRCPSAARIDGHTSGMLAMTYESLYHQEDWDRMGRISDLLLEAAQHLDWSVQRQQYCLSYPLVAALQEGPDWFAEHVAPWLEGQEIVEPRFAFNLACYQAKRGTDEALIEAVARALELGKPKEQFLHDDDFAEHLEKPRMKELLGS